MKKGSRRFWDKKKHKIIKKCTIYLCKCYRENFSDILQKNVCNYLTRHKPSDHSSCESSDHILFSTFPFQSEIADLKIICACFKTTWQNRYVFPSQCCGFRCTLKAFLILLFGMWAVSTVWWRHVRWLHHSAVHTLAFQPFQPNSTFQSMTITVQI